MNQFRRIWNSLEVNIWSILTRKVNFLPIDYCTGNETLTYNKVFCKSDQLKRIFLVEVNQSRRIWNSVEVNIWSIFTRKVNFLPIDDCTGNETLTCNKKVFCKSDQLKKIFLLKLNQWKRICNSVEVDIWSIFTRKVNFLPIDDCTGNET